jgi:hypothetical protein
VREDRVVREGGADKVGKETARHCEESRFGTLVKQNGAEGGDRDRRDRRNKCFGTELGLGIL